MKKIVEMSGGKISVLSKGIGLGSILIFSMQMRKVSVDQSLLEPCTFRSKELDSLLPVSSHQTYEL